MSQKSANSCIRPDCTVKMVRYACSKCNTARYCSIRCQIDDWQRHKCIGDPLGVSGDQPLFDLVAQITSDALSFQRAHFHIRRDNTKLTPTERVGLVGRGADSAVLAVVSKHLAGTQKQTSYALKISISDGRAGLFAVAGQMDILVHRALQNSYASSVTPLPKLHADWTVFSSLRNYFAHFDVRHYEGSQSQRDDRVIINEIVRTAPPGVAPDAIVSMPVHMSCALMEMLTITVAGVVSRYLTDEDAAPRMPALINNVCMNVVASLATLRSSRVTHNDLHTGNVYIANFPAEIKSVDYRIGDGYYSVPTMHPGFKGMFIQQTRVVIADFGRVAMGITNTDLGVWLSGWPRDKDAMALMNWPNYDNPGYDMWLFACDLIKLYGGRVPLPSMPERRTMLR